MQKMPTKPLDIYILLQWGLEAADVL
jgi:hypothetical protein